jgi:glutathione synthase/RimK-type ligase-like ATP-grasp enzyme
MRTVIIVAPKDDSHARSVGKHIERLGLECLILDSSDLPTKFPVSIDYGQLDGDTIVHLGPYKFNRDSIAGVWWRRPSEHRIANEVTSPDANRYAARATRTGFLGGLMTLSNNFINPPHASERASLKPVQLELARRCGLRIPKTMITSSPENARCFANETPRAIYKTVTTWHYQMRETRMLESEDFDQLDSVRFAPDILQEYIEPDCDYRVTVVGTKVFAARINVRQGRSLVDSRLDRVPLDSQNLPPIALRDLMKLHDSLGLVYGAYDFRLSASGELYFLEVNPEGQFLFVEIETGLPISEAIAEMLSFGSHPN